jgi:hypothetical protein
MSRLKDFTDSAIDSPTSFTLDGNLELLNWSESMNELVTYMSLPETA